MVSLLDKGSQSLRGMESRRLSSRLSTHLPFIVRQCKRLVDHAPEDQWVIRQAHHSLSDMQVLTIAPSNDSESFILYLPKTARAVATFRRQELTLRALQADLKMSNGWELVPRLVHEGKYLGKPFWIAESLPGVELLSVMRGSRGCRSLLQASIETIKMLHAKTARTVPVDDALLEKWLFSPAETICRSIFSLNQRAQRARLDRVTNRLADSLIGRQLVVGWIHGDYWPGNILVSPDEMQVTGIVDWDQAQPDGLPFIDLISLLVSTRHILERRELGRVLVDTLNGAGQTTFTQGLWDRVSGTMREMNFEIHTALTIFWLRHLSANLVKSRRYAFNPIWAHWNYRHVVDYLDHTHSKRTAGSMT